MEILASRTLNGLKRWKTPSRALDATRIHVRPNDERRHAVEEAGIEIDMTRDELADNAARQTLLDQSRPH